MGKDRKDKEKKPKKPDDMARVKGRSASHSARLGAGYVFIECFLCGDKP